MDYKATIFNKKVLNSDIEIFISRSIFLNEDLHLRHPPSHIKSIKRCVKVVSNSRHSTMINCKATTFNLIAYYPNFIRVFGVITPQTRIQFGNLRFNITSIEKCVEVVSNLNRSITADCKVIQFILQVCLTRSRQHFMRLI